MSSKPQPWRDREVLKDLYIDKGHTQGQIADRFDCSQATVHNWLHNHDIPTRSDEVLSTNGPWKDEETVRKLHHDEGRSVNSISKLWGVSRSVVKRALEMHDIDRQYQHTPAPDHVPAYVGPRGYEEWNGPNEYLRVHRLLAIACGADPHDVFSGNFDVHHKNGVPWDNRPENIELMHHADHARFHTLRNNPNPDAR